MSSVTSLSDIPRSPELDTPDAAYAACTVPDSEPGGSPDNSLLFSRVISEDDEEEQAMLRMLEEEQANKRSAASSGEAKQTINYWSTEDDLPDDLDSSQAMLRDELVQDQMTEGLSSALPQIVDEDDMSIKCNHCGFFAPRIPIGQQCNVCQKSFSFNHIVQGICTQCWGTSDAKLFLGACGINRTCKSAVAKEYYDTVAAPIDEAVSMPYDPSRCIGCDGSLKHAKHGTIRFPDTACGHRAHSDCAERYRVKKRLAASGL